MSLPPQAYTKETLIQAYNWLRSQPAHVQELAKSPDALVSLYSKAQIHGENYLSRTNLQSFKSELKNLAHMMGDLDEPNSQQPQQNTVNPPTSSLKKGMGNPPPPSIQSNFGANASINNMTPMISESNLPLFASLNQMQHEPDLKSLLDTRSWNMIQEIKNHLNLSSETEALRVLIALGYQKIRPQF